MDLCEAYVLCLIDEVVDVLTANSPESLTTREERAQEVLREMLPEDASTLLQVCMTAPLDSMAPSA